MNMLMPLQVDNETYECLHVRPLEYTEKIADHPAAFFTLH